MNTNDLRNVKGRVHSFQSFGTLDGPGIRAVVFLQGCPLRCSCCHNPDTWDPAAGEEKTAGQVVDMILRCRGYFGSAGGVTLSGGEPLMQPDFARAIFTLCHEAGINTCLDTSGCRLDERVEALLTVTDLVLLDHKYPTDQGYRDHVGMSIASAEKFLAYLDDECIPTRLRRVIIQGLTDSEEATSALFSLGRTYQCVTDIELLPFHRLCVEKYRAMGIRFPLENIPDTTREKIDELYRLNK